eukprot:tig00021070_g17921.t1
MRRDGRGVLLAAFLVLTAAAHARASAEEPEAPAQVANATEAPASANATSSDWAALERAYPGAQAALVSADIPPELQDDVKARLEYALAMLPRFPQKYHVFKYDNGNFLSLALGLSLVAMSGPDGQRNRVIVSYGDMGFWRMMHNLILSANRIGLAGHMLILSTSAEMHAAISGLGVRSFLVPPETNKTNTVKFQFVFNALLLGFDIFLQEPDGVILLNPFDYVPQGADLAFMTDGYFWRMPDLWEEDYNIGTFFAKSSPGALEAIGLYMGWVTPVSWDQYAFNRLMKAHVALNTAPANIQVLDLDYYPNGGLYFWLPHLRNAAKGPATVHSNFVDGPYKAQMLQRGNLWLVPDQEESYGSGKKYLTFTHDMSKNIAHQMRSLRIAVALARASGRVLIAPAMTCRDHPGKDVFRMRDLPQESCHADHWLNPVRLAKTVPFRSYSIFQNSQAAPYLAPEAEAAAHLPVLTTATWHEVVAALAEGALAAFQLVRFPDFLSLPFARTSAPDWELEAAAEGFDCRSMRSWAKDVAEANGVWNVSSTCFLRDVIC